MDKDKLSRAVNAAKRGDKQAFEELYNAYHSKLYFFVLKNVKSKEAAEDITHETFLKSMEKISSLEDPDKYSSWLHSIAYNKCKDLFRDESYNAYFNTDEERENAIDDIHLNEPIMLPDDYAVNKELKRELKKIIDELKPDMKSAVILYYYDNLSIADVAEALGIKENAVKQKLFQARKKLKRKIDKMNKSGVMLSAVPLGAVLTTAVSPKYASAAVVSGEAIGSAATTAKVIGISSAAVIAMGIPIALGFSKNSNFGYFGGYGDKDVNAISSGYSFSEQDSVSRNSDNSHIPDKDHSSFDSVAPAPEYSAEDSVSKYDVSVGSESTNNSVGADSTQASSFQSDSSETDSSSGGYDKTAAINSLTGEKLLSMTVGEALELGDNDYEFIYPRGVYDIPNLNMYKCSAFPEYCFQAKNPETYEINNPDDKISFLNLYRGAYINEDYYVGMTYNELKEKSGEDLEISLSGDSLRYAVWVTINGRAWEFGFELTNEQDNEIIERLHDKNPDNQWSASVDISDINPVAEVAVYDVDRQ